MAIFYLLPSTYVSIKLDPKKHQANIEATNVQRACHANIQPSTMLSFHLFLT